MTSYMTRNNLCVVFPMLATTRFQGKPLFPLYPDKMKFFIVVKDRIEGEKIKEKLLLKYSHLKSEDIKIRNIRF